MTENTKKPFTDRRWRGTEEELALALNHGNKLSPELEAQKQKMLRELREARSKKEMQNKDSEK